MGIIVRIDRQMAEKKMSLNELAEKVGISTVNLSLLKNGKVKGVRFNTLEALCKALECNVETFLNIIRRIK